ncbi:terpene synthase family protein [Streptomyces mobaraensis]|uniref:terpene synthase family protein n=1 Tax=Streptomyces mobaraensis TaxID=35621 RepID=UPI0033F3E516
MTGSGEPSTGGWKNHLGVPVPRYPWPWVPSPFKDHVLSAECHWYDTDYTFLSADTLEKYKRHGLTQVTAYIFPVDDVEAVLLASRLLIFHTVFDDYFELCPATEMAAIRDHLIAVLLGEPPTPTDLGLFRQVAAVRDECRKAGMPDFWFERLADSFHRYITYGVMEEVPYKLAGVFPSLAYGLSIHDAAIGMRPHFTMAELVNDCLLPEVVYRHPMLQRLLDVHHRLFVVQNDLFSLDREIHRETEVINHILALRHWEGMSLHDACADVMRMNDRYVKEAADLHAALLEVPSFAPFRETVDRYARSLETILTGMNQWYQEGRSIRYDASGGYPEPEYASPRPSRRDT